MEKLLRQFMFCFLCFLQFVNCISWPTFQQNELRTGIWNGEILGPNPPKFGWMYNGEGACKTQECEFSQPLIDATNERVYVSVTDSLKLVIPLLLAFNASTGQIIFSFLPPAFAGQPLVTCSPPTLIQSSISLVCANSSQHGEFYNIDARTGEVIWVHQEFDVQLTLYAPMVSFEEGYGMIFFATVFKLYALNSTNGTVVWTSSLGVFQGISAYESHLYVAGKSVHSLNLTDGAVNWNSVQVDATMAVSIFVEENPLDTLLLTVSLSGAMNAMNLNGIIVWTFSVPFFRLTQPAFDTTQGIIYAGSRSTNGSLMDVSAVHAINATTSRQIWQLSMGDTGIPVLCVSALNEWNVLIISSRQFYYRLHALNASTGQIIWTTPDISSNNYRYVSVSQPWEGGSSPVIYAAGDYSVQQIIAAPTSLPTPSPSASPTSVPMPTPSTIPTPTPSTKITPKNGEKPEKLTGGQISLIVAGSVVGLFLFGYAAKKAFQFGRDGSDASEEEKKGLTEGYEPSGEQGFQYSSMSRDQQRASEKGSVNV